VKLATARGTVQGRRRRALRNAQSCACLPDGLNPHSQVIVVLESDELLCARNAVKLLLVRFDDLVLLLPPYLPAA